MYEVELKVPADHDAVRERLAAIGADPAGAVEQADTYFEHPVRDFGETDEAVRIRRETRDGETRATVTYKGPLVETASKTRAEYETAVADGEAMARLLEALGFERFETVEKRRERFEHDGYTVALDRVRGLGAYVEVETAAEPGAVESAREGAVALLADLGLDAADQVRMSYLGLLLDARAG